MPLKTNGFIFNNCSRPVRGTRAALLATAAWRGVPFAGPPGARIAAGRGSWGAGAGGCLASGGRSRREESRRPGEVVGDEREVDLQRDAGEPEVARAGEAIAALGGAEDLLHPAAHRGDRPVPGAPRRRLRRGHAP